MNKLWRRNMKHFNMLHCPFIEGRDRAVGIASCYGLDGAGIESLWGRDFPHLSRTVMEPTQTPIQWVLDLARG